MYMYVHKMKYDGINSIFNITSEISLSLQYLIFAITGKMYVHTQLLTWVSLTL